MFFLFVLGAFLNQLNLLTWLLSSIRLSFPSIYTSSSQFPSLACFICGWMCVYPLLLFLFIVGGSVIPFLCSPFLSFFLFFHGMRFLEFPSRIRGAISKGLIDGNIVNAT